MTAASIIIPCVGVDDLLARCVRECERQAPDAEIIVLLDENDGAEQLGGGSTVIVTGPVTIAAKRNRGAHASKAKYLAFIDSDAYPDAGWLSNGIAVLEGKPDAAIAGGPDLPWPDETGWTRLIGLASRSPLISAKSAYRKYRAQARDCPHLPSCNMIVRRDDYLRLEGMKENLRTGEDLDYCYRVRADGGRIIYQPDVAVFHRDRNFRPFVLQRMVYGASVWRLAKNGLSLGNLYLFAPGLAVAFFASAPLSFFSWSYAAVQIVALASLAAILCFEAMRTARRIVDLPGLFAILGIGLLVPGLGTVLGGLGLLPDVKTIYKNSPTGRT
jgi:GT2 family glycosyltransferase